MNAAFYLLCIAVCALSSGCVLAPGTSARTPKVSGRVLSATTRQPVSGATVALHEAPKLRSTITDSNGRFSLNETRNFHLFAFLGICGPEYNMLSSLRDDFDVSHPAFHSQRIRPWDHWTVPEDARLDMERRADAKEAFRTSRLPSFIHVFDFEAQPPGDVLEFTKLTRTPSVPLHCGLLVTPETGTML